MTALPQALEPIAGKLLCPECHRAGETSVSTQAGITTSSNEPTPEIYGEDGKAHTHNPNVARTTFRCSHGHTFERTRAGQCWCGWKAAKAD